MDMELTQNFLRGKNPCAMGYRWFVRNNLAGGDYQAAMDTQVAAGRVDDARWLLENFGSTNSVLELEHLEADNFVYAGTLIVHGDVRVPGQLLVGRSLQAGGGIRAGKLEAGEEIQCGGAIFAGELLQAGGSIKAAWSVEVEGELRAEDLRCGWELRGVAVDTLLAAYLVRPDQRAYDLADLSLRLLNRDLSLAADTTQDPQAAFDFDEDSDRDAEAALLRSRAVFDLDPLSLVHGVFFARKKWPSQPKIARAVTTFIDAGCVVSTPTCGPCLGGYMGILAAGERCVSTTNRNFRGRMGHVDSEVYLAGPQVAAASAILGKIAAPKEVK